MKCAYFARASLILLLAVVSNVPRAVAEVWEFRSSDNYWAPGADIKSLTNDAGMVTPDLLLINDDSGPEAVEFVAHPGKGVAVMEWRKSDGANFTFENPGEPIANSASLTFTQRLEEVLHLQYVRYLTVRLKILDYKLTYDANGGEAIAGRQSVSYPTGYTLASGSRTGYSFVSWKDSQGSVFAGGQSVSGESFSELDNVHVDGYEVKLSAQWTPIQYTVHFDGNGATGGSTANLTLTYDQQSVAPECGFVKAGSTFSGWLYGGKVYQPGDPLLNLTAESGAQLTFQAQWSTNPHQVTFSADGRGAVSPSGTKTYSYGATASSQATPFEGALFVNWTMGDTVVTDQPGLSVMVTGDADYVAHFTNRQYGVIFKWKTRAGLLTNETQFVSYGSSAAEPDRSVVDAWVGNHFVGWDRTFSQIVSNIEVQAQYEENRYVLAYDGNGATSGGMSERSLAYGETYKLPTCDFERRGYVFAGWGKRPDRDPDNPNYSDKEEISSLTGVNEETAFLYALWKPIAYNVAFQSGGGEGQMDNQAFVYDQEQALSPNQFVKPGCTFQGWRNGDAVLADGQVVSNLTDTADATVTLTAIWDAPYWVAYDANGGSGEMPVTRFEDGTVSCLASNAFVRAGYSFQGWATNATASAAFADGAELTNKPPFAVIGMTNVVYAVWGANTYTVKFDGNGATEGAMEPQTFVYGETNALTLCKFKLDDLKFTGWTNLATQAFYPDGCIVSNLTTEVGGEVVLKALWNVGELSRALKCDNLVWTSPGEGMTTRAWTPDFEGKGHDGGSCAVNLDQSSMASMTAIVKGNGTLRFYWSAEEGAKLFVDVCPTNKNIQQDLVTIGEFQSTNVWNFLEISVDNSATLLGEFPAWICVSTGFTEVPQIIIDNMTWTPAGVHPEPTEAPEISEMTPVEGGFGVVVGNASVDFDYQLLGTNELMAPLPWPVLTNVTGKTGKLLLVAPVRKDEPQMFYRARVIQKQ